MGREQDLRLARPLRCLVTATLVCNILVILYLPFIFSMRVGRWEMAQWNLGTMLETAIQGLMLWRMVIASPRSLLITGAVALCGCCAAVILVQARNILTTVERRDPFCYENARALGWASWACFWVSLIALVRLGIEVLAWRELAALATYNALAVPIFFLGGLLFRVMAALFHQAARMKEEQELTI